LLSDLSIRSELPSDSAAVFEVLADSFPTDIEAKLVDELRGVTHPQFSLVAESGDLVVGHILFTPVEIDCPNGPLQGMGLGPLAVRKRYQRQGVGSALVADGLSRCRDAGELVVVVFGHSEYYPRFGFRPGWDRGLYFVTPGPNPAFMVLELTAGALPDHCGEVRYHPAIMAL